MNKLCKIILSMFLCMTMLLSGTAFAESAPGAGSTPGTGDTQGDSSSPSSAGSSPVLVGYKVSRSSISKNVEFNIDIKFTDLSVGTKTADDIIFLKTVDSFTVKEYNVKDVALNKGLLSYTVTVTGCKWAGGSSDFGFKLGYVGASGSYVDMTVPISECFDRQSEVNSDKPVFKASANTSSPIRAGEEGEMEITIRNLGMTSATDISVDVASSENVMITDGGLQDITYIFGGMSETISLKYRVIGSLTSEKQTISISLYYYYDNGADIVRGSAMLTAEVASEISSGTLTPLVVAECDLAEKTISASNAYNGFVTLKNIGKSDMSGITVGFADGDGFILTGGTETCYIEEIKAGEYYKVPVKIKTLPSFSSYKQTLAMTVKYSYIMNGRHDETINKNFVMFAGAQNEKPLPVLSAEALKEPLAAARKFAKKITVENKGGLDMENVTIRFKGAEGSGINVLTSSSTVFIEKIEAGKTAAVRVEFETSPELAAAVQTLEAELSYTFLGQMEPVKYNASVQFDSKITNAPEFRLAAKQGSAVASNQSYTYTLTLTNYGSTDVRDLRIALSSPDGLYFTDGSDFAGIDLIKAGKSADITVKFNTGALSSPRQNIAAKITYYYGATYSQKQGTAEASAVIIAATEENAGSAVPNIIIGSYDAGAPQIAAGDNFTLNIDFYNTDGNCAIENLIMTVNASGSINVHGGVNTYFYPYIAASGKVSEEIQLKALSNADTGTSSVGINFKYDYVVNGKRSTVASDQTIFIPVYQPDKMNFEVMTPKYTVYAGNETYITTTYINKGRSDISNVKAEIVGEVAALSTSKVIGTVQPGGNGSFDFIVTPFMGGECSFTIKLTYEDATFTEVVKELPVTFNVEEMSYDPWGGMDDPFGGMDDPSMQPEEGSKFPWLILWIGIGVLVAGGVVAIILIVRHKKKKKKKITEDDIDWEDDLDDIISDNKTDTRS